MSFAAAPLLRSMLALIITTTLLGLSHAAKPPSAPTRYACGLARSTPWKIAAASPFCSWHSRG